MKTTSHHWPERQTRHKVGLTAEVITSSGVALDVEVADISLQGCKVVAPLLIKERVHLNIHSIGNFTAEVRWSVLNHSGVRFLPRQKRDADRHSMLSDLAQNDRGAAAIEYGLISFLVALTLIVSLALVGHGIGARLGSADAALPATTETFQTG